MDSWDDEDFDVPQFNAPPPQATKFDDEEEEEEEDQNGDIKYSGPPKMRKEKLEKKKAEEEAALAALADLALQANETPEERKLRERLQVEEADHSLTDELFGGGGKSGGGGIESLELKTLQDYLKVAVVLGSKMSKGKSFNITSFYKELLTHTEAQLTVGHLEELSVLMHKRAEAKESEAKKPKVAKKVDVGAVISKKKKKEMAAKQKHEDVFGGVETDAIDNAAYEYEDAYDDFM